MAEYSYFKFVIRNEKYLLYKKFGAFIFLLNGIAFFYISNADVSPYTHLLFIALAILQIGYAAFAFFSKSRDKSYIPIFLISALAWITELGYFTPALILVALMVMQILAQYKITLTIERNSVKIDSYRENEIPWNQIESMVLKDGLISIELANNKIIQVEPDLTQPILIQKGGSLNQQKWLVGNDYPRIEQSVNALISSLLNGGYNRDSQIV